MKKNTKEKILSKAFELFTEKPYEEVTIDEIAEEVGVSKGSVFHYFDSKYQLACESLFIGVRKISNSLFSQLKNAKKPMDKLEKYINFFFENSKDVSKVEKLFMDTYGKKVNGEDKSIYWLDLNIELYNEFYKSILEIFNECDIPNPKQKSLLLMACLDGLYFQFFLNEHSEHFPKIDGLKEELFEIFIYNHIKKRGDE